MSETEIIGIGVGATAVLCGAIGVMWREVISLMRGVGKELHDAISDNTAALRDMASSVISTGAKIEILATFAEKSSAASKRRPGSIRAAAAKRRATE